jgi:RHS repeat-associated protein
MIFKLPASAALALAFVTGSSSTLHAANPPIPIPLGKVMQSIAIGGNAPPPVRPCWNTSGKIPVLLWPGAPPGAIWFGPIPVCAKPTPKTGPKSSGAKSGQIPEPPIADGPSGNRACPGHVDGYQCAGDSGSGPGIGGSLRERAFIDIAPNQPGLGIGELTYYVEEPKLNFGSPEHLAFNSILNMEAHYAVVTPGFSRYTIFQPDGSSILFNLSDTIPPSKPYAKGLPALSADASSQAGVTWTNSSGAFVNKPALPATLGDRLSQFVPGYGWVHFPITGGLANGFTTITGRVYDWSASSLSAVMGVEIIRKLPGSGYGVNGLRDSGFLRQIKTPAGLLDVVPLTSRSFIISQYAASQVGLKSGDLYAVTGNAVFSIKFEAPSSPGLLTTTRSLGTEKYTTNHTVSISGTASTWTQMHTNGPFQFRRILNTPTYGSTRNSTWKAKLLAAPGMTISPTGPDDYTLTNISQDFFPTSSVQTFNWSGSPIITTRSQTFPSVVGLTGTTTDTTTGVNTSSTYDTDKRLTQTTVNTPVPSGGGSTPSSSTQDYGYTLTADEPNQPFDFRPRSSTVKYGSDIIQQEYFAYPIVSGEYVEIHEISVTPGAAFGSGGLRTVSTYYGTGTNKGRPRQHRATDGTLTTYTFADQAGGELLATVTANLTAAGLPVSGSSTRTIVMLDVRGLPTKITNACYLNTGAWKDFEEFNCTWDTTGNPKTTERKDLISTQVRVLEEREWDGVRLTKLTDEQGVVTEYEYYPETVIPWKVFRKSVAASGSYPAQEEILTTFTGTYTMDAQQLPLRTETIATTTPGSGGPGLTLTESSIKDPLGRSVSSKDTDGNTTSWTYSSDRSTVTTTLPNDGTKVEVSAPNGDLLRITGTAVVPAYYYRAAISGGGTTDTVYTGVDSSVGGTRYETTERDIARRTVKVKTPTYSGGTAETVNAYNSLGQLTLVTATGQPATIYEYDSTGDLFRTTVSGDNATSTLTSSTDRITETSTTAQILTINPWRVTTTEVYAVGGSSTKTLAGTSRTQLAGFTGYQTSANERLDPSGNITRNSVTVERGAKLAVSTLVRPGASNNATSTTYYGLLQRQHESGSSGDIVYGYDTLARSTSVKQPRHANAAATVYEANKSRVASKADAAGNSTSYTYGPSESGAGTGLVTVITAPDSTTTTSFGYDLLNRRTLVSGTGTYPVGYEYTAYGELWKMKTWQSGTPPMGGDETTWGYQASTGLLVSKTDAAAKTVGYTYDNAGRPLTRSWHRGVSSTYSYNSFGQIWESTHSDGGITPGSTFIYDRLGRPATTTQVGGHSWAYTYDASTLRPDTETITYNTGASTLTRVIDRSFDSLLRPTGWQLKNGGTSEYDFTRTYESAASRPYSFTGGGSFFSGSGPSFSYAYMSAAPSLVQGITSGATVSTYNAWETNRDVLDYKQNTFGASIISKYDYAVNNMGRRSGLAETGSAYASSPSVEWGYNSRGEVTLHDHTTAAYESVYEYDTIGNRTKAAGGTTLPGSPNHAVNTLNQYTSIGGVSPGYDDDGNLTSDAGGNTHGSARTYQWDAENQLRQVNFGLVAAYRYDPHGRRISKTAGGVTTWFIYDGWNLVAEYQGSALTRTHLWGLDLSGTTQGAGGVGGLLCTSIGGTKYYPLYDGNGNICQYIDGSGGIAAQYEYSPFGHLLNPPASGSIPASLNFRFSTKFNDSETDFYYYGYRYYSSWMARWLNRDPIEESGGSNLYVMIMNDAVDLVDVLGQQMFNPSGINLAPAYSKEAAAAAYRKAATPAKKPGGCGSSTDTWGGDWMVPDKPFGYDFYSACETHDKCYETCGARQADCDNNFLKDMLASCPDHRLFEMVTRSMHPGTRLCQALAKTYHSAVAGGGKASFAAAQKSAGCCP